MWAFNVDLTYVIGNTSETIKMVKGDNIQLPIINLDGGSIYNPFGLVIIYILSTVYEEYQTDPTWGQYAEFFEVLTLPESE